jgi:hypothetical protein
MRALSYQISEEDLFNTLNNLVMNVDTRYEEELARVMPLERDQEGRRNLIMKTLCWVTFAVRPLSATELELAIAVKKDAISSDDHARIRTSVDTPIGLCAGLIVLDQETQTVRLLREFHLFYSLKCPDLT